VTYAEPSIADYADRAAEQLKWWQAQSGRQGGDPAKLARALVVIASEEPPPRRSSPAPMPSPSPSSTSPISRRRSTPTASCPPRSLSTSPRPSEP